jgi:hypothetical protein
MTVIAISSFRFLTNGARTIWKGGKGTPMRIPLVFLVITVLVFSSGCTGWAQKRERALKMVGISSEEVKKGIGEPSVVAKNPENAVIWIYRPPYKLMPNQEGSVYLEFQDGKVVKAFSLK